MLKNVKIFYDFRNYAYIYSIINIIINIKHTNMKRLVLISMMVIATMSANAQLVSNPAGFVISDGNGSFNPENFDTCISSSLMGMVFVKIDYAGNAVSFRNVHEDPKSSTIIHFATPSNVFYKSFTQTTVDTDEEFESIIGYKDGAFRWVYVIDNNGSILFSVKYTTTLTPEIELGDDKMHNFVAINVTGQNRYNVQLNGVVENAPVVDTLTFIHNETINHVYTTYDTITVNMVTDTVAFIKTEYFSTYDELIIKLSDFSDITGIGGTTAEPQIQIYPNPTTSSVNIDVDENFENCIFKMVDSQGRTVVEETLSGQIQLNVQDLGITTGMYFLNFTNTETNKTVTKKLLVQ